MWGDEEHVRSLFGDRVASLEAARGDYVGRAQSPAAYRDFCKATSGPVVGIYAGLDADGAATLDRAFLEFATSANGGAPGGPAEYRYDDLLVIARRGA